jgi:hypothetical protein
MINARYASIGWSQRGGALCYKPTRSAPVGKDTVWTKNAIARHLD